jgi:hypothetical protein
MGTRRKQRYVFLYTPSTEVFFLTFQGGNNIHSRGVTAIAETLKENTVLTTVSLIITQTISLQERRYVH